MLVKRFKLSNLLNMPAVMSAGLIIITMLGLSMPVQAARNREPFDCDDMIKEFNACTASTLFVDMYTMICQRGTELTSVDIIDLYKLFDEEIATNACIAKVYREPQVDRKALAKKRRKEYWEAKKKGGKGRRNLTRERAEMEKKFMEDEKKKKMRREERK